MYIYILLLFSVVFVLFSNTFMSVNDKQYSDYITQRYLNVNGLDAIGPVGDYEYYGNMFKYCLVAVVSFFMGILSYKLVSKLYTTLFTPTIQSTCIIIEECPQEQLELKKLIKGLEDKINSNEDNETAEKHKTSVKENSGDEEGNKEPKRCTKDVNDVCGCEKIPSE